MKNTIFKNFTKKILRSEAFISVIIVFVLALGIIGTSYAIYMDVDTDTDYQLVKVGDLSIGFDKGDSTINLANLTPTDDEIAVSSIDNLFSFYIYNTGTYTAEYRIKLVPVLETTVDASGNEIGPNEINPDYIKFQICKDNKENCKDIENLNNFVKVENGKVVSEAIYVDELSPKKVTDETNPSAYYFLRMWIKSDGYGTSEYDNSVIGKRIKYKVVIEANNASGLLDNKNTLAGAILNNENIKINNTLPNLNELDTTLNNIYKTQDDYGTSYYFRGNVDNNYVNFAGMSWKVVRINGDGTIRLILNSSIGNVDYINKYMYGNLESEIGEEIIDNLNDSNIKVLVDNFYKTNIKEYDNYLADTIYCGNKNDSINIERVNSLNPTLECDKNNTNDYSRYTKDEYTLQNGIKTNGDLLYPIGLISVDEVLFAGGNLVGNYLSNIKTWTMTSSSSTSTYMINETINIMDDINQFTVSPVINLRKDILVDSGDGTENNPYKVKIS